MAKSEVINSQIGLDNIINSIFFLEKKVSQLSNELAGLKNQLDNIHTTTIKCLNKFIKEIQKLKRI